MKRLLILALLAAATALVAVSPGSVPVAAQNRMTFPLVSRDEGHAALGLAIRRLNVTGTFMEVPAHPDDEQNALFALFTHGMGLRSIDVQMNRGEGGQNEIGTELFRDIGVLRTSELVAAHQIDGAEQYFTRAIDYGYSFDPEEVIGKWGREQIVGDLVRLIRTFRPEVLLTMNIQGRGGDRAHEATTILAREAYLAAGDSTKFPEQSAQGLRPWQPRKLYFTGGSGVIEASSDGRGRGGAAAAAPGVKLTRMNTGVFDPLLGQTYAEIGADAHSYHKCQGTNGLPALPGFASGRGSGPGLYQLMACTIPGQQEKDETSLFDGIDTRLSSIAQFAGTTPPAALTAGLAAIVADGDRAHEAFAKGDDAATAAPIEAGLAAVRALRAQLASLTLDETARFEIDFRLALEEQDYVDAVLAAHGLSFDAVADDGLVIAGQPVKLSLLAVNRGASEVSISNVAVAGLDGAACTPGVVKHDAVYTCSADAKVPAAATLTTPYFSDHYWQSPDKPAINEFEAGVPFGVPFAPTPFRVTFHIKAGSVDVTKSLPVQFRYVKDIYNGDKRMELNVVPAFSVKATPSLSVLPVPSGAATSVAREVHVTVTNGIKGRAQAVVALEAPAGWRVTPATATVDFLHEDESLSARFQVTTPARVPAGAYTLHAVVTSPTAGPERFATGYQDIEYPHVQRRQVIKPADAVLKVVDVKSTSNVSVGYIVGVGDQVPPALQQLGARVSFIDQDELAWGDLSKYDVIMTGVRAYERRADLRAYNRRLLDYAERGGTVIVQYNKFEFNQAQYGPYPASVSSNRVSDELAPVTVLVPDHPVFNTPNKIGAATWKGWVQERGLYFLGEKDPRYVDLISMTDSFKDNPGVKLGSLVEARTGKGRWLYLGIALWRQLPAGTDGAYQLLANLISLKAAS
jgi:LmbE family N-acetylglucosaminyl deacetylase